MAACLTNFALHVGGLASSTRDRAEAISLRWLEPSSRASPEFSFNFRPCLSSPSALSPLMHRARHAMVNREFESFF